MQTFDALNLTLNFSGWYFFLAALILLGYTFFIYRTTLPPAGVVMKSLLIFLRFSALLLLLLIFFEPVLVLRNKITEFPQNLIFIDNSSSIKNSPDSAKVNAGLFQMLENLPGENRFFLFGSKTDEVTENNINPEFNDAVTDFESVFDEAEKIKGKIGAAIIVSDGIITSGENPLNKFEKAGYPVFTIGMGDTTEVKDIILNRIFHNEYIYANTPTVISAEILNRDFAGKKVTVNLIEDGKIIGSRQIELSSSGINRISFDYQTNLPGEKKIGVSVSTLPEEGSGKNNFRETYINVSKSKLNVLIISGAPSSDLVFVKNSLKANKNIELNTIVELSKNKPLPTVNINKRLDSAEVFILLGYPAKNSGNILMQEVKKIISGKNKPIFFIAGETTDFGKLNVFEEILPLRIKKRSDSYGEIQPNIINPESPIIKATVNNDISEWENLPPVIKNNSEIETEPGSEVIANVSVKNNVLPVPLFIINDIGKFKRAVLTAGQIWRWKLQSGENNSQLFDKFIYTTVKWLSTDEKSKRIFVSPEKKIFFQGEEISINGQVFNDLNEPVNDAEIVVKITGKDYSNSINLLNGEPGRYSGNFNLNVPGDYNFTASVSENGKNVKELSGKFSISRIDAEKLNLKQDVNFLGTLAGSTGGKYFNINKTDDFSEFFKSSVNSGNNIKYTTSEIVLWADEWMLLATILLFSFEWFLRKKRGML